MKKHTYISVEQQEKNFDPWFATDIKGNVIVCLPWRSKLPRVIAESNENFNQLLTFFEQLETTSEFFIGPKVTYSLSDDELDWCRKGLYVFEREYSDDFFFPIYRLLLQPTNPLKLEKLPFSEAQILSLLVFPDDISVYEDFDIDKLP